jgi:general secretion pathway protein D
VGVYAISQTNQLIVKAQKDDMEVLDKLIKGLDIYVEPMTRNYFFTYVDAAEIYNGLEQILDIPSRSGRFSRTGAGQVGSEGGRPGGITLVTKTNSIVLTAPPSVHRIMNSIVRSVDMPGKYEAGMIRSYKIENADVDEVANAISELIETRGVEQAKPGEPTYRGEIPESPVQTTDSFGLQETDVFVTQVEARVTVSKSTNSVIVLATARQHRELEKLIKELDERRKQVLIKAMIVEVTTTDDMDLGVELDYFDGDFLSFTSFGLSTINPDTGIRDIVVSPGGTAAVLRPGKVQAIFNALQGNDNIRIESTPQVLVNDNAVGTIQSIAEEPTRQTNQGETTTSTSFGEYVTAGTQFFVTPHISENNYLRVQYQIMLNSFGKQADPELPPKRNTSTIQSEATVPDGSTIVVGGIQSSSESESVDKVPLLGDIPIVGLAFRNTATRKRYITTYLFITTTIMKSEDFGDLEDVSKKALKKIGENNDDKTISTETVNTE